MLQKCGRQSHSMSVLYRWRLFGVWQTGKKQYRKHTSHAVCRGDFYEMKIILMKQNSAHDWLLEWSCWALFITDFTKMFPDIIKNE